jgi:hypothetical protein
MRLRMQKDYMTNGDDGVNNNEDRDDKTDVNTRVNEHLIKRDRKLKEHGIGTCNKWGICGTATESAFTAGNMKIYAWLNEVAGDRDDIP